MVLLIILFGGLQVAVAQQIGRLTPEVHPELISQKCSKADGCTSLNTSIVLDANVRWLHNVGGTKACKDQDNQALNTTICTDDKSCVENCALEGVDYSQYGLKTAGNAVTLNLFVNRTTELVKSSPRIYLFDEGTDQYANFQLLNREFAFDVDTSKAGCGINGALFLSEMSMTGHKEASNAAGARYGVGYCDAQCPKATFMQGRGNSLSLGACCAEMDLWEANNAAMAFTSHPCNITGVYGCEGLSCGSGSGADKYKSVCDQEGCDFNPYRNGNVSFYGPGKIIDSMKPLTVVTQFITTDGTDHGNLKEIRRIYIQAGKQFQEVETVIKGVDPGNSMTDEYCAQEKAAFGGGNHAHNSFKTQGGMEAMGGAIGRGMVLVMAIWSDDSGSMNWLDSTIPDNASPDVPGAARGPCPPDGGTPAQVRAHQSGAAVTFSNIRSGEIGSTHTFN